MMSVLPFGVFAFFDEFPEVPGFTQFLVFGAEVGAVEEVFQGVFVQHAVDDDVAVFDLEVEAVVLCAEAVDFSPARSTQP